MEEEDDLSAAGVFPLSVESTYRTSAALQHRLDLLRNNQVFGKWVEARVYIEHCQHDVVSSVLLLLGFQ